MLTVENITYEINNRTLVKNLSFSMRCGEVVAILGANGAGKSTLLKMLSGEKKNAEGNILLNGKAIHSYASGELAKKRAVLSQHNVVNVDFLVKDIVMMGRYPHYKSSPGKNDRNVVRQTMDVCGVTELEERSILTLSGGEQQRVQLARVLAQIWDCPGALLLMDEPVSGMDLQYQQQTLAIVTALARKDFMVITVLHDINLAAQYADRILMLKNGRKWNDGSPAEVLNTRNVYNIFSIEADVNINRHTLKPFVLPKEVLIDSNKFHSNSHHMSTDNLNTLKETYLSYKNANPGKRIRDVAAALNVSEAELLMTGLGETVTRLNPDFESVLKAVPTLGHVMALTRNEYCVNERKGAYEKISFTPHAGLVLGDDIDLRLFLGSWKHGFAVVEERTTSLQFFDGLGIAVHKIYLTEKSNPDSFKSLVESFTADDQQAAVISKDQQKRPVAGKPDSEVDLAGFQEGWNNMQDTHEFFMLMRKFGVSRIQAMHLAPAGRTKEIALDTFKGFITECAERQVPVMVFTGNPGCIQIHSGLVTNLLEKGEWFNVLDPEFNLHLRLDGIASVWHVVKPSVDGDINSLEIYDKDGEMIVQFFGKRKPGIPELEQWREVLKLEFA